MIDDRLGLRIGRERKLISIGEVDREIPEAVVLLEAGTLRIEHDDGRVTLMRQTQREAVDLNVRWLQDSVALDIVLVAFWPPCFGFRLACSVYAFDMKPVAHDRHAQVVGAMPGTPTPTSLSAARPIVSVFLSPKSFRAIVAR